MKKSVALFANAPLFLWFCLSMTGFRLGDSILVEQAWRDDGIFMLIYFGFLMIFIFKEKMGRYLLTGWLLIWLILQFFSHWSFTIANWGIGSNKIEYYKNTIKLIHSTTRYIPG